MRARARGFGWSTVIALGVAALAACGEPLPPAQRDAAPVASACQRTCEHLAAGDEAELARRLGNLPPETAAQMRAKHAGVLERQARVHAALCQQVCRSGPAAEACVGRAADFDAARACEGGTP